MLHFVRRGAAGLFQTSKFRHGRQKGCGFLNRTPGLITLFAVGLLSFSPTIAQSQVNYGNGTFWKMEQLAKSPECISSEQAKTFINYAEGKLFQWRDNTMVYDDHDNSLETQDVKNLIDKIKQKICPPVKLYHVGVGPKPKLFDPVPPSTSPGDEDPQKREQIEIGSSGRAWTGLWLGVETLENFGHVRSTETSADTGAVTNQFSDSGDPLGFGVIAGYNFRPWNNNIVVGPFASFDWLNQTINHTFTGGQFLGTTTHWIFTAGAKGGYVVTPGLYLYGLAGASWLNQSLNVNFTTAASSNVTTPGFTLGLGGEYQPSSWRLFGNPVSVFLQYQHTWWSTANFNTPTSSPGFNYAFKREDDTIKLGFNIYLSAPTPPLPTRGLITK
jgi:opacity protein-like surface antigen